MAFGSISVLWNKWNIRGCVMLSLWLQVFLILFAPLRKKTANRPILFFLWLAYLMADWVVAFAIGLISHSQSNSSTGAVEVDGALLAFWASFLLLHLGGPDTITAFSMEDSSLWRRHLLSLIFQVGSAIYVFVQILLRDKSLVIPTMLVFLAGLIKNAERTAALNFSSLPNLREWVLSKRQDPDDVATKFVEHSGVSKLECSVEEEAKLSESTVVKHAYYFFQMFLVLLGDLMFTFNERKVSCEYFHKVSTMDALRVISVELQFMYEVLHTKTLAIRSKWSYIFRFIAFTNIAMAFIQFNRLKKHHLPKLDVKITYSLLFGGIALDVITLLMLIFSDWTVVGIKQVSFLNKLVATTNDLRKPRFATCEAQPNADVTYMALDTPLIFQRWSETISACNLFSEFLDKSPRKMWKRDRCWGIIRVIRDQCWGIIRVIRDRCHCIICVIRRKCHGIIRGGCTFVLGVVCIICNVWDISISDDRRPAIIGDRRCGITFLYYCGFLLLWAMRIIMFCPVVVYHLALVVLMDMSFFSPFTVPRIVKPKYVSKNPFIKELWIFIFLEVKRKSHNAIDEKEVRKIFEAKGDLFLKSEEWGINCDNILEYVTRVNFDASIVLWHIATEMWYNIEKPAVKNEEREFSKILSDYMMYLLLNQPNLMSTVGGIAQIRSKMMLSEMPGHYRDVEEQCKNLYKDSQTGSDKESTLYHGIKLARELESLGKMKWKVMSGVWVEMLSYAAGHIKGEVHVQVLSRGGELLAFVWLLIAHFGCFYKPEWGIGADYSVLYLFDKTQDSEHMV